MKILTIGDPHFQIKNEIESNLMCDRIYEVILKEHPDIIICLGDILDTHSQIYMEPLKRAITFLHRLSQMSQHLYVLIGNHDRPNNTAFLIEDSPFMACKMWPNTTIVDKVCIGTYLDFKFVCVPYVPIGRFMEALNTVNINEENINEYKIIFAHQEFKGCKMGAITSINGDEWNPSYPLCISGHIHDYQVLQQNIIYPGTPIQLGYGVPPSKGVMMIEINLEEINHSFFDLKLPKKMIVNLTPEELANYQVPDNCFLKLICRGDTKVIKEIVKLDSVKEMLKNPKVKLSIQEDRSKTVIGNVIIPNTVKNETIPFQKRLTDAINQQNNDIKNLFGDLFGEIN